jgi:hypothetical protein
MCEIRKFQQKIVSSLFKEETPASVWYRPTWAHPQSHKQMFDLENYWRKKRLKFV